MLFMFFVVMLFVYTGATEDKDKDKNNMNSPVLGPGRVRLRALVNQFHHEKFNAGAFGDRRFCDCVHGRAGHPVPRHTYTCPAILGIWNIFDAMSLVHVACLAKSFAKWSRSRRFGQPAQYNSHYHSFGQQSPVSSIQMGFSVRVRTLRCMTEERY